MSLTPVAIKEANVHIQGLVKRVHDLEGQVRELSATVKRQNEDHTRQLAVVPLRMNQTMRQKDEQIEELKQQVATLTQRDNTRETLVQNLRIRCKVLDEITRHRDALESVLSCLDILQEPDYCSEPSQGNFDMLHAGLARETDLLDDNDFEESDAGESSKMSVLRHDMNHEANSEDVEPVLL